MSAYVVDDITINTIVSFVYRNNQSYSDKYYYCLHALRELGYVSKEPGQDKTLAPKRLAEEMFTLNCESIEQRYGEGEAEKFRPLDFTYKKVLPDNVYQVLKSIGCWIYQTCEGNVTENPLYKAIDDLQKCVALAIVKRSDRYESAKWK